MLVEHRLDACKQYDASVLALDDVLFHLADVSQLDACQKLYRWMHTEVLPALQRTGHYAPEQSHEPPIRGASLML